MESSSMPSAHPQGKPSSKALSPSDNPVTNKPPPISATVSSPAPGSNANSTTQPPTSTITATTSQAQTIPQPADPAKMDDSDGSINSGTNSPKKKKFKRYSSNNVPATDTKPITTSSPFTSAQPSPKTTGTRESQKNNNPASTPSERPNSKTSTKSSMPYPYSTSEDQYEESEEDDISGEENLSSDTSSLNVTHPRRNKQSNTALPYRKKSFTSASPVVVRPNSARADSPQDRPKSIEGAHSRTSSVSNSTASQDSTMTVTLPPAPTDPISLTDPVALVEPTPNTHAPSATTTTTTTTTITTSKTTPLVPTSTTDDVTATAPKFSALSTAVSPTTIPTSALGVPEKLDLVESKQTLPPNSTSALIPKDRRPPPPSTGNPNSNSMTVETETVSAVPTLAVAASNSSLKVKKSADNVNKSLLRAKKKKSNRGHGSSKAEVFAARIASAVDEVQSSDSDETFVYESNPHENSTLMTSASSSSMRPRFHTRNPSSSSLQTPSFQQSAQQAVAPSLPLAQVPDGTPTISSNGPDSYQTLTQTRRSNAQKQYQQQLLAQQQQQLLASEEQKAVQTSPSQEPKQSLSAQSSMQQMNSGPNSGPNSAPLLNHQHSFYGTRQQHTPNSQSSENLAIAGSNGAQVVPMQFTESAPSILSDSGNALKKKLSNLKPPSSPRPKRGGGAVSGSTSKVGLKKQASSQLRSLSSKHFDSLNGGYKSTGQHRRWNRNAGYDEEEEEDDYNDIDDDYDDDDEDDYYEYNETTPLRNAGATGSVRGPRRLRKNGANSLRSYSPHNYQRKNGSMTRYQRIRAALWLVLAILAIMAVGFIMGFLLATTKPLRGVVIADIFDVLVSDEELLFDVVVEGINPGFMTIEVREADLDIFARSEHVKDEYAFVDGLNPESVEGGKDRNGQYTMLLGNIQSFEVPLTFEGGLFSRHRRKSVGQLRLVHPGRNTTASHGDDDHDDDDDDDDDDTSGKKPNTGTGGGHGDFDGDDDFGMRKEKVGAVTIAKDAADTQPESPPEKSPKDGTDAGQKRWARVSVKPFDLIVRGVLRYELMFSSATKVASISKVRNFHPHLRTRIYACDSQGHEFANIIFII